MSPTPATSPGHGLKRPRQLNLISGFILSSCAACSACLVTNPMEVVKTRLQLDGEGVGKSRQYKGILDAFSSIGRKEGVRGIQAGLSGALVYQVAMNGMRLGMYEPVQRALVKLTGVDPSSVILKASSGALSGALGATLGSPIYMIKSRLQAQRWVQKGERYFVASVNDVPPQPLLSLPPHLAGFFLRHGPPSV